MVRRAPVTLACDTSAVKIISIPYIYVYGIV